MVDVANADVAEDGQDSMGGGWLVNHGWLKVGCEGGSLVTGWDVIG